MKGSEIVHQAHKICKRQLHDRPLGEPKIEDTFEYKEQMRVHKKSVIGKNE